MLIIHVHIQVKPESVEAFKGASLDNARFSVQEPGIARFDVEFIRPEACQPRASEIASCHEHR